MGEIFIVLGKFMLITSLIVSALFLMVVVYIYGIKGWLDYRKAKMEIFSYVKTYKRRCTGNNRFLVTVESLQDSFREYDTDIINKVWLDLVNERIIERDPQDEEWCVR
jgi:hypothetical protein